MRLYAQKDWFQPMHIVLTLAVECETFWSCGSDRVLPRSTYEGASNNRRLNRFFA